MIKTVIMAGGKGTRIAKINSEIPKPMIPILGKPILEYQIETLKEQGFNDIVLVIGHQGNIIKDYFKNGNKFGVNITYVDEKNPLGTAGALYYLRDNVGEDFLLINGDIIFEVDLNRFYQYHKNYNGLATILTHPNSHPYDSGVIIADNQNCVTKWLTKETERKWYKNRVNAGIHFISKKIYNEFFLELKKQDLDRDILKQLIQKQQLFIYNSSEYIKDMGTPERLVAVEKDLKNQIPKNKNMLNKQKAIFLDRDGTINKYVGFLKNIDDFELIENVSKAIKKINDSGYLVIVITNQPVIARGELSIAELEEIHNKMETLIGNENAYLDAIYYCPHHPDKGFEGERIEYKIICKCRKPNSGMLYEAAKDFNIDLSASWMVGDSENDINCGINAGCKTASIGKFEKADLQVNSLFDFVERGLYE